MKTTQTIRGHAGGWRRTAMWMVTLALIAKGNAADLRLALLKTKTVTYTNVTVWGKSKTDLYINHSLGIGNVKIKNIEDEDALLALGFTVKAQNAGRSSPIISILKTGSAAEIKSQILRTTRPSLEKLTALTDTLHGSKILGIAAVVGAAVYLAFCYCLKLICLKAGRVPGALVWLPLLQTIPMFRAARMSGGWLLACLIPGLNLVAQILWSFKIVKARGKNVWVAIALLLPVTALFAFLYLAFSRAVGDLADAPIRIGSGPLVFADA